MTRPFTHDDVSPGARAWLSAAVVHEALTVAERLVGERGEDDPPTYGDLGDAVTASLVAKAAEFGVPPEIIEKAVADCIAGMVVEHLRTVAAYC